MFVLPSYSLVDRTDLVNKNEWELAVEHSPETKEEDDAITDIIASMGESNTEGLHNKRHQSHNSTVGLKRFQPQ